MHILVNVLRRRFHSVCSSSSFTWLGFVSNLFCPAADKTKLNDGKSRSGASALHKTCRYPTLIMTSLRGSCVSGPFERNTLPT